MNCHNCGAPMELFERRRYYFCSYCGTFRFIETPAVDGVHVLEQRASAFPCPLCGAPLAKSLLDEVYPVDHCQRCRGLLMTRGTFADVVSRRRARESGPPAPPIPMDQRELKRQITCPSCRAPMDVHPYYGPGNVVIDTCRGCHLVWLDFGELKQIAEAPGQDRGGRSKRADEGNQSPGPPLQPEDGESGRPFLVDVFDALLGP